MLSNRILCWRKKSKRREAENQQKTDYFSCSSVTVVDKLARTRATQAFLPIQILLFVKHTWEQVREGGKYKGRQNYCIFVHEIKNDS